MKNLILNEITVNEREQFKAILENNEHILITTHMNADGDGIGSVLAMGLMLRKMGKTVNIVVPNDYPHFLKWMEGTGLITIFNRNQKKVKKMIQNADYIFYLDFNDPGRLGDAEEVFKESSKPGLLIDHHPDPVGFSDYTISRPGLGSTAELVYNLFSSCGYDSMIDNHIAEALFVGIMTDTGNFSFACSYPEIWNTVAELMKKGVDKDKISGLIYDNYSEDRMRLMGYCLHTKMKLVPGKNTGYISLTERELEQFNHRTGDTEGFVNLPFSIKGMKFTALFIEKSDHIKISFRSRGKFDVNRFASLYFRGGGHLNASGGEWDKPLDSAVDRFVELLDQYDEDLKNELNINT